MLHHIHIAYILAITVLFFLILIFREHSTVKSFIFHVETHPVFKWYEQCVTFNSFPSQEYELAYNFFGFVFLYGIPLIMIIVCYSRILFEIYRINALKKNGKLNWMKFETRILVSSDQFPEFSNAMPLSFVICKRYAFY